MTDGLVAALARAQGKFPPIVKSHTNPAFKGSQYADVADVLAAVRPVLAAEGIVVLQWTRVFGDGSVTLVTVVTASGDEFRSEFPLYVAGLTAQQVGSLLTYHRRYQLCALLGVHPVGDDDDGNLAATAPQRVTYGGSGNTAPVSTLAKGDPYALAAANPPEKPLAAMTAGEMARYGESIGVRVSGNKTDILRTLEPYVKAATGEPFDTSGPPAPAHDDERPEFSPVVAGSDSGTARKAVNSSMATEKP
jgi:hypothetical protein